MYSSTLEEYCILYVEQFSSVSYVRMCLLLALPKGYCSPHQHKEGFAQSSHYLLVLVLQAVVQLVIAEKSFQR